MSELRTEFERLHPVPEGVVFEDDAYYSKETTFYLQAESDAIGQNTLWIGFQSGHAALEAKLEAARELHDKTVALYDYLLETDEEGLIHHATQMRDVCLAIHKYRNADPSFIKGPK